MRAFSSLWKIFKNGHFVRFYGVPSLAHFTPYLADSCSEEQGSDSGNEYDPSYYSKSSYLAESPQFSSSDVIEILKSLRNEPLSAFSYFNQLKKVGFQHDVQSYLAIIKILCPRNRKGELEYLFKDMIGLKEYELCFKISELLEAMAIDEWREVNDGGSSSLIPAFSSIVKSFVSVGMFDEAIHTLFDIKRHGITPCIFSCNYLICRLTHHGKTDLAVAVYRNMKNLGLNPNAFTFAILVKAYNRGGNSEKVWEMFLELGKDGARDIDAYGYNVVIQGLSQEKRMTQVEIVFVGMLKQGFEVNYRPMIHGYCQTGAIVKALTACDEMEKNGIKMDCVILTSILRCWCMIGRPHEAIQLFNGFKAERNFVDKVAYSVAMDALCKMGQLDMALGLFQEMKSEKLIPDVVHYTTLISGCCQYREILHAKKLMVEMKLLGIQADEISYDVLVGGFSRCGLVDEMLSILNEMECQGVTPRPLTHNKIIEGLCSARKVKEAEKYFMNVYPRSIGNYASMICGYCESGRTTLGYALFNDLLKKGILPCKCGLKLLSTLCMKGENDRAVKLFETLLPFGNDKSMIAYGKLVNALCCAGDMVRAQWVFDQIVEKRMSPGVTLYTMLMKGYFHANSPQKSIDLFIHMTKMGMYPDTIAFTVLLDGLSKVISKKPRCKNDVKAYYLHQFVVELWSAMKEMKVEPDIVTYTVLIDYNCKSGNIKDAVLLFNYIIERALTPDVAAFSALISGYCKMGHLNMAYGLLKEMQSKGIQPDRRALSTFRQYLHRAIT